LTDLLTDGDLDDEEMAGVNEVLETLYERLDELDASTAEARAASILTGLQFTPEMQKKRCNEFSGGWRMRVALARALFLQPTCLLLDEPTSALDAQSENQIREALDSLSENRTTLIIAHRLSTILDADQIVVMDQGRIIDQGTHEELLSRDGIYTELFNLQFDLSPQSNSEKRKRSFPGSNKNNWASPLYRLSKYLGL